ncbi:annexin A13-like [Gigantopelta aegis]|uniref:annexin A13-like n=1 Tax=Gigantopelta aegis TaxID=1735272 RepID=UPI001B88B678|nr:annexin A13-like [Gigantopelta aegis]
MSNTQLPSGDSDSNIMPVQEIQQDPDNNRSDDPDNNMPTTDQQSCDFDNNIPTTDLQSRDPDDTGISTTDTDIVFPTGGAMDERKATIFEAVEFNEENAAAKLRKAMKGLGTDEHMIISILCEHSNAQRQIIKERYKTDFGRDLAEDLKSDLGGHFLTLCLYMLMPARYFDAFCLRKAMQGAGTKESTLIEILVSRSNEQINEIKEVYKNELFNSDLEEDIVSETSGDFRRVLVSLLMANREESQDVDDELVKKDKEDLYEAGVGTILGTDEDVFNKIFVSRSLAHLQRVFSEYKKYDTQDIEEAIKEEMSGHAQEAFLSIARFVKDPMVYFATCFEESFAGPGTDDERLMQLTVSHSEVDLATIARVYEENYMKSLSNAIRSETSGDYRKLLIKILDPSKTN